MTKRRAYVVHLCLASCPADYCPCTPMVCHLTWFEDEPGHPYVATYGDDPLGEPLNDRDPWGCVHGQLGVRYPHPTTADGRLLHMTDHPSRDCLHQWAEGDTDCTVVPYEDPGEPMRSRAELDALGDPADARSVITLRPL